MCWPRGGGGLRNRRGAFDRAWVLRSWCTGANSVGCHLKCACILGIFMSIACQGYVEEEEEEEEGTWACQALVWWRSTWLNMPPPSSPT